MQSSQILAQIRGLLTSQLAHCVFYAYKKADPNDNHLKFTLSCTQLFRFFCFHLHSKPCWSLAWVLSAPWLLLLMSYNGNTPTQLQHKTVTVLLALSELYEAALWPKATPPQSQVHSNLPGINGVTQLTSLYRASSWCKFYAKTVSLERKHPCTHAIFSIIREAEKSTGTCHTLWQKLW